MADKQAYREPIMWTSTTPGYNQEDRETRTVVEGVLVVERIPQTGSTGDWDDRRPVVGQRRWLPEVNHYGNIIPHIYTNAAAHLDTTTTYAQNEMALRNFLGWFWTGACPVALLATGELRPDVIHEKSLLTSHPCAPGTYHEKAMCTHAIAERKARMDKNAAKMRALEAAHHDSTQRQIDAAKESQRELIESMAAQQKASLEASLAAQREMFEALLKAKK